MSAGDRRLDTMLNKIADNYDEGGDLVEAVSLLEPS
jgi:hypothetical protein